MAHAEIIEVNPGTGTISAAVNTATAGDVLVLADGVYSESSVKPANAITIQAADGARPVINLTSRFEIKADFTLQGAVIQSPF